MEKLPHDPTPRGLAIAIIALARFVRAERPGLVPYLKMAQDRARALGVAEDDLVFLDVLIGSLAPPPDETGG